MSNRSGLLISLSVAAFVSHAAAQNAQSPPARHLQAREFFYLGAPEVKADKTAPKTLPKVSPKGKPVPTPKVPVGGGNGPIAAGGRTPDGTPIIPVVSGPPLGLKYTIVKRSDGQQLEVPDNTIFHTGDKIQIKVETNGPGYLYIVSQGPTGSWKAIFPAPEIGGGNNHVDGARVVTLPAEDYGMTFVQPAGAENVTIVLSRQPVADFEELIYSLQDKSRPVARPAAQPDKDKDKQGSLVADARIGDPTVERLRTLYSRDLIIEKVTPETPGEKKETAVYVVNPARGADSRLVADLHLVHQ